MNWLRHDHNTTAGGDEDLGESAAIAGVHHVSLHVWTQSDEESVLFVGDEVKVKMKAHHPTRLLDN
jgi:hypothetical protein